MQSTAIALATAGSVTGSDAPSKSTAPSRNWAAERARLNDPTRQELTTAERCVLDAIEVHIADHAEGWPTQKRIAAQTGLCERQVRRCVEVLVRRGFLRVRIVAPGGELPSGTRTESVRLVYSRGPALSARRHGDFQSPALPTELPARGHVVRIHADSVSDKRDQSLKKQTPPLPPVASSPPQGATPTLRKCEVGSIQESNEQSEANAVAILSYWREILWPELRGRLDSPSRVATVLARLADGFTVEELRWVIDGATESEWHQADGQRQRLTVEVLYAKPEMVSELAARGRKVAERRERRRRQEALRTAAAPRSKPTTEVERVSPEQIHADLERLFGPGSFSPRSLRNVGTEPFSATETTT